MTDEIEYRYVKGQGWVAGYKCKHVLFEDVDWDQLQRRVYRMLEQTQTYYNPRVVFYADGI